MKQGFRATAHFNFFCSRPRANSRCPDFRTSIPFGRLRTPLNRFRIILFTWSFKHVFRALLGPRLQLLQHRRQLLTAEKAGMLEDHFVLAVHD